jgi:hypothetical protein
MIAKFTKSELSERPSIQLIPENSSDEVLINDMFEDNNEVKLDYAIDKSNNSVIVFKLS